MNIRIGFIFFLIFSIFYIAFPFSAKAYSDEPDVLFYDDFSSGNLQKWMVLFGNWVVINGVLQDYHIGKNLSGGIEAGKPTWDNYRLEIDVNSIQGITEEIGFRNNKIARGRYALVLRHTNLYGPSALFLNKIIENDTTTLATKTYSLVNNKWYKVKIEVINDNIKVWINDTKIFDYTDNDTVLKEGFINLISWSGDYGVTKVHFDNVKVTSLNPKPFLDLPWDYKGKGFTFTEAALSINSFFDHAYPLYKSEPAGERNSTVTFLGPLSTNAYYSGHDGYDYGARAKAKKGSMLAAAAGWATYHYGSDTGHSIRIDHGNGYQTRYYHMKDTELVTTDSAHPVWVEAGEKIGEIGFSGNVDPPKEAGAHIHFNVVQDKDGDGNFDDDFPSGLIDPFGWQSNEDDPWEYFTFNYKGEEKQGNKSYYLWKYPLDEVYTLLTPTGKTINVGRYTLEFPEGATDENLYINLKVGPIVDINKTFTSIGTTLIATATDLSGNSITTFQKPFTIKVDFANKDLSNRKKPTIAFYSTSDGTTWNKTLTEVDLENKIASAQIDHFSQFALIAEREDTEVPLTEVILDGNQGSQGWFKSDVQITLDAKDNEEGLGVDYTVYKVNDEEWQEYTSPFTLLEEGHYTIQFYSVDLDENIEEVKSVEFTIDKTLPTVSIDANPKYLWPPDGKMVDITITGEALDDNLRDVSFEVIDEYNLVEPEIIEFGQTLQLVASRRGNDYDGRAYLIRAIVSDLAGNTSESKVQVVVPHDYRN